MALYLPQSVRSIQRMQEIARVLSKHGFGHFLDRLDLVRFLPFHQVLIKRKPDEEPRSVGRRLAMVCEELGPTFIKLAQMLSTRPDLIPPDVLAEFKKLQDQVAPFDIPTARRIIEEDLGVSVEESFRSFESEPVASGSMCQVHTAVDHHGERLVVKVKRPGIDRIIELDIRLMEWFAHSAERLLPELVLFHPTMIIEEFSRNITRELDFINEASSTARFAEAFQDDPEVIIPRVRWEFTGPRVLTLQRIEATRINDVIDGIDGRMNKKEIAHNLADVFFRQFFELGLFHADPHPGNLMVHPPNRIAMIDFGSVGVIDDELAGHLAVGLVSTLKKETDILIDVLADMGAVSSDTKRSLLRRDLSALIDKYYGLPLKRLDMQSIFIEMTEVLRKNDVALPRDLVLMTKSLVEIWGVALQLDPDLNLVALIEPRIKQMLRERFTVNRLIKTAGISTWHILNILKNLPRQLRDLMRSMSVGQWRLNVQHQNIEMLANELDRSSNRLAFSIMVAAIILASSMVISETQTYLFGVVSLSALGAIGFVIAGAMGLLLVFAIWRSGRMY